MARSIAIKDHKGNQFSSKREMCRAWGVDFRVFSTREGRGWSMQECLEGKVKYVTDFRGLNFSNMKEMCKYYHMPYSTVMKRLSVGVDLKYALLDPDRQKKDKNNINGYTCISKDFIIMYKVDRDFYSCLVDGHKIILHLDAICKKIDEINEQEHKCDIEFFANMSQAKKSTPGEG